MKKNDCNIPFITQLFGWALVGVLLLYFFKESFEYSSWKCFLEKQGSLIGAIIGAIVLTFTVSYTIKKQAESVKEQIDAQNNLSEKNRLMDKQEEVIALLAENTHFVSKMIDGYGKAIKPIGFAEKNLWSNCVKNTSMTYSLVRKYNLPGKNDAYELASLASTASFLADRIYHVDISGLAGQKSTKDFMGNLLEACHSNRSRCDVSKWFNDIMQDVINIAYSKQRSGNDLVLLTSLLEKLILNLFLLSTKLQNKMINE